MKKYLKLIVLITVILGIKNSNAQWANGQDATYVLGQADFSSSGYGTSDSTFYFSSDVAIDEANGKMYIADNHNNRILRFSYPIYENQPNAELVLGQLNFNWVCL